MTTTPNWQELYLSICRCDASYLDSDSDTDNAFKNLGSTVIARLATDKGQAVITTRPGHLPLLTIAGTRVTSGTLAMKYEDIKADVVDPMKTVNNVGVYMGIWDELEAAGIYEWALDFLKGQKFDVEGHSKGAVQALYAWLKVPADQLGTITAWEPPKAGDDRFWAAAPARANIFVHERDLWFSWPWALSPLKQRPSGFVWIHDNTFSVITEKQWPGVNILNLPASIAEHEPTSVEAGIKPLLQ